MPKKISVLHLEAAETLFNIELKETLLKSTERQNALRMSNGWPTEDDHFEKVDLTKKIIDANVKLYLKQIDALKNAMLSEHPHLKK